VTLRQLSPSIDTHAHVFHRGLALSDSRRYTPTYDADTSDYLAQLDRHGVARGVLIQPSFLGTDNSYLLGALAQHPERLRGVVVLDPREDHDLEKLNAQGVRGIRLNLIGVTPPDLDSRVWRALEKRMGELGWHLEVQARGRQWDELTDSLTRWSSSVVIDHLGLPARNDFQARKTVATLAALEHVWVKVSAPYRSEVPERALAELLDTTGPARMLFGSDWPFTGHETNCSTSALTAWARKQLGEATFTATLPANAQRLLQWK